MEGATSDLRKFRDGGRSGLRGARERKINLRRPKRFVFKMMMIGVLRNNRNSTSRVSNRSRKFQSSSALIKKNSCSRRVKEKENRLAGQSAAKRE